VVGNDWAPSRRKGRVVNGILGAIGQSARTEHDRHGDQHG
jgi:hypothetical protein